MTVATPDIATRARSARGVFDILKRREPQAYDAVLAHIPADAKSALFDSLNTDWVPFDMDKHRPRAIVGELGPARALDLWDAYFVEHAQSPVIWPIVSAMLRLMGKGPEAVVAALPRGWGNIYRGFGTPSVTERRSGKAVIELIDVPEIVFTVPEYFIVWTGSCRGFLSLTNTPGKAHYEASKANRKLVIELDW